MAVCTSGGCVETQVEKVLLSKNKFNKNLEPKNKFRKI